MEIIIAILLVGVLLAVILRQDGDTTVQTNQPGTGRGRNIVVAKNKHCSIQIDGEEREGDSWR